MEKRLKKEHLLLNANESNISPMPLQNIDLNTAVAVNRYPDSDQVKLRMAVAKELNATRGLYESACTYEKVDPENLIMGTGSDEVLKLILETFLSKDGVVLAPSPSFSEYRKITDIVKGRFVEVKFEDLSIDIDRLIESANKEKAEVIFLANPNNPTGQLLTLDAIERLILETNALVVVDEAYAEFCAVTAIQLALCSSRVIVTRTLSKAYGMASLRLGFALAQPGIIVRMAACKLTYNISGISEWLAIKALEGSDYARRYTLQVVQLRQKALCLLKQLPSLKVYESSANFILLELEDSNRLVTFKRKLESTGIRIRTFEEAGGRLGRSIRVTLTDEIEFHKVYTLIKAMEKNTEKQKHRKSVTRRIL